MDYSLPVSSIHGIFQAIVLEWIATSFSRGSSQPRARTWVSRIVDRRFTICFPESYECQGFLGREEGCCGSRGTEEGSDRPEVTQSGQDGGSMSAGPQGAASRAPRPPAAPAFPGRQAL